MNTTSQPLDLTKLKDGQTVKYRTARSDGSNRPGWSQWKTGTLYLQRRETPLPKKYRRGQTNNPEHEAGAIITLAIREIGWAEYSQNDYEPEFNTWSCEDYELEIQP